MILQTIKLKKNIDYIPNPRYEDSAADGATNYDINGSIAQKVFKHNSDILASKTYKLYSRTSL